MELMNYMTGIQHIGLPTNDLDKTIEFYKGLGFEVAYQTTLEEENMRVAFLQMKTLILEAYENHEAVMKMGAIAHIAIDVKEIEKVFQIIKSSGHKMIDLEVKSLPFWERGVKFFNIEGPNCEIIEFCERI